MSEWKKVKIGDFLTEREGRYKPDDSKISKYKRLDKIDFSGTIHISDKPTKTDMIIVHPGDLVISGINVAKGAVAVYQGDEPVCATIHYSSYTFNSSKVDLEYFKYFVKSPAFIAALQKQVKGGIKTEIKPKHLLPLDISIPDLQTQQEIVKKIALQLQRTGQLSLEIESQKNYIKQLRQTILQDAIEGKLTADWRKQNLVQQGNPDYDAEALFEQIQKERNIEKKHIKLNDIGWYVSTLDEFVKLKIGGTPARNNPTFWKPEIPWVSSGEVANCEIFSTKEKISYEGSNNSAAKILPIGTVLIAMIGQGKTRGQAAILRIEASTNQNVCAVLLPKNLILSEFLYIYFCSRYEESRKVATGGNQAALSGTKISKFIFPLPPLAEQREIAKQVEKHLQTISYIEKQITDREELTKQLMQSILKDAFEEG